VIRLGLGRCTMLGLSLALGTLDVGSLELGALLGLVLGLITGGSRP
jgi:hypothetical protein